MQKLVAVPCQQMARDDHTHVDVTLTSKLPRTGRGIVDASG